MVIIGAMKCATTTLHHHLGAHRSICTAAGKELDYFSRDELWDRGPEWYLAQFPDPGDEQVLLDSSPNYTKRQHWPDTAARLAGANPDARLIYLVREPIARTRSAYLHELAAGREHRDPRTVLTDHTNAITQTSRYAWQLEPFLAEFGPDQVCVVRFDHLVAEPVATLELVLEFLGLEPTPGLGSGPVPENASDDKTMPTALVRRLRVPRARGLLRRLHPRLAEAALPDAEIPDDLERSIRRYLRADLEALQRTGLVDVADWIDLAG